MVSRQAENQPNPVLSDRKLRNVRAHGHWQLVLKAEELNCFMRPSSIEEALCIAYRPAFCPSVTPRLVTEKAKRLRSSNSAYVFYRGHRNLRGHGHTRRREDQTRN